MDINSTLRVTKAVKNKELDLWCGPGVPIKMCKHYNFKIVAKTYCTAKICLEFQNMIYYQK